MVANADGIRDGLRAVAADVLFRFGAEPPEGPIVGAAKNKHTEVKVVMRAISDGGNGRPGRRIGSWMSPAETLIVTQLAADTMTRVDLAKRCSMPYDPKFKALVGNLIDRGILIDSEDGHGIKAAG